MKQIEFYAKHQKKGLMISKTMRPFIYTLSSRRWRTLSIRSAG